MQKISDELKNKLAQFQTLQQQLQMVVLQKQQMALEKGDAEEAEKELDASTGEVYKSVGPILMRSDKASLKKELKETITSADSRITLLDKQEQKLALKAQELQKELQSGLKGLQQA